MSETAAQPPAIRDAAGRFTPGSSGNPNGRSKGSSEISELARSHGPAAIARLVELMRCSDPQACIAAAKALLDRGYGRPAQPIEGAPLLALNFGDAAASAEQGAMLWATLCRNPMLDAPVVPDTPLIADARTDAPSSQLGADSAPCAQAGEGQP